MEPEGDNCRVARGNEKNGCSKLKQGKCLLTTLERKEKHAKKAPTTRECTKKKPGVWEKTGVNTDDVGDGSQKPSKTGQVRKQNWQMQARWGGGGRKDQGRGEVGTGKNGGTF